MNNLIIPAAGKDQEFALKGVLARPEAFNIRPVEAQVCVHPERDPAYAYVVRSSFPAWRKS